MTKVAPLHPWFADKEIAVRRASQFLIFIMIASALSNEVSAESKRRGDGFCNRQVIAYLRSVGFSSTEVNTICRRASDYLELEEEGINKYEALAWHIEQMWKAKNPSNPISQGVINHAVRLMRPNVCNERVARYLKSEGFQMDTVRGICDRAEALVTENDLTKKEAMRKALLEYAVSLLKINDDIIREAMNLLE